MVTALGRVTDGRCPDVCDERSTPRKNDRPRWMPSTCDMLRPSSSTGLGDLGLHADREEPGDLLVPDDVCLYVPVCRVSRRGGAGFAGPCRAGATAELITSKRKNELTTSRQVWGETLDHSFHWIGDTPATRNSLMSGLT